MRRFLLTIGLAAAAWGVAAQTQAPAAATAPAQAETSLGVKSANIFQIAPGADADP